MRKKSMADEIQYDKLLPIIPLLGSALAVSFDVGYFYGIGIDYFTFFSLSEHVLFAIEALPIALMAASTILLMDSVFSIQIGKSRFSKVFLAEVTGNTKRRIAELLFGVLCVGCFWYTGLYRTFWLVLVILPTMVAITLANTRRSRIISMLIVGTSSAMLFGDFLGWRYVTRPASDLIVFKSGDRTSANVIRAGERGVLYALPDVGRVEFARWDDIGRLSGLRPNLFNEKVD